jgi:hypothetical protein
MERIDKLLCGDNGYYSIKARAFTGLLILQQMFNYNDQDTCISYTLANGWNTLNLDSVEMEYWKLSHKTLWDFVDRTTKNGLFTSTIYSVS